MKNFSSQVPSGRIVCVLQNCCTHPSFVFERILINCHPAVLIFSVHSLSELGVTNDVSRNDCLFCHTLYNLAMIQQKNLVHAYSLSFHLAICMID